MAYSKLASAIYNDVVSGLRGYTSTPTMSIEQLEDDIVDERLALIKAYILKGVIPKKDLLRQINCIPVDCKDIENCRQCEKADSFGGTPTMHFEIPPVLTDFGGGIEYIGSPDMLNSFIVYTNPTAMEYHKYRRRSASKPYVYVSSAINENGMIDCYVFNAPFLKRISVIAVFKDERMLEKFGCSCDEETENTSFLNAEIKDRLTKKKIYYYRQLAAPIMPNDQTPK